MLLLRISDIHFNHPLCSTRMDPDRPYRTLLIRDAKAQCADLGPPDALMVGGDVAYHGAPAEYGAAIEWILDLAQACGCPAERIYVVPGNHDVDRGITAANRSARNAQAAILSADERQREKELFEQFVTITLGRHSSHQSRHITRLPQASIAKYILPTRCFGTMTSH